MFDVIWTDPDRELVGERRARKEEEKNRKERDGSHTGRNSLSTRSSSSSSEKPFGFSRSKSQKRAVTPLKATPSGSIAPRTPANDAKYRRGSIFGSGGGSVAPALEAPADSNRDDSQAPSDHTFMPDHFLDHPGTSPSSSSRDSIFSRWTDTSVGPPSTCSIPESGTKSSITQTLGPSSYITKSTEVTVVPRTPETDISQLISEVTITADGSKHEPPTPPRSPYTQMSVSLPSVDTPINLLPGVRVPMRPTSPSWTTSFNLNNPNAWKAPEDWDCDPAPDVQSPTINDIIMEEVEPFSNDTCVSLDLHGMQREIRRMAAATPETILLRLKESWGLSHDGGLYRELEMEKKRWMLSALSNMDPPDLDTSEPAQSRIAAAKAQKILALYESQAVASYLAGAHHPKQIYHLSPSPLSHVLFPNIHPVLVPAASPAAFPLASQLFGSVYSLSLPSMLSSQEIPQILKQINRCLSPGGTFHMTMIDPMPCASTLGPHMRRWLEDNLMFNVERNFRCTNPSKLFPIWLTDASLRGGGSAITTVKFLAAPDMSQDIEIPEGCSRAERETKIELRSIVGRMLWIEVWGAFVEADSWWWDDPVCMDECMRLRTHWEYSLIEAVKES